MKDFADALIDAIIENESSRIEKVMIEVTQQISKDFAQKTYSLLDLYYDNYTPVRYVRVYGKKRKLKTTSGSTKRKPRAGQVSLHAAITRDTKDCTIAYHGIDEDGGYIGGVRFDASKFKGNGMRHLGKGISEWNIVENFLFAGDGVNSDMEPLEGDIRSHIDDYSASSADLALMQYMSGYGATLDKHFKNALKKYQYM